MDIREEGDRRQPCRTKRSITKAFKRFPFTCTTVCGMLYRMLIHLRNSDSNPVVSKTGSFFLDDAALCPVVGHSRPTVVASCTVCSGVFHQWIHHLWPQGAVPPGFNPLRRGWVYRPAPEAPRKRECRRGPRHFWNCLSCWASALRQDPP